LLAKLVIEIGEKRSEKIALETQTEEQRVAVHALKKEERKQHDAELERRREERDAKRDTRRDERDFVQRCLVPGVVLSEKEEARWAPLMAAHAKFREEDAKLHAKHRHANSELIKRCRDDSSALDPDEVSRAEKLTAAYERHKESNREYD
jgi:hypothetical protein